MDRTRQLHFWVTPEELEEVRLIAKSFALTITEYVRYVLHLEVERHQAAMKGMAPAEIATTGMLIRSRVAERDQAFCQRAEARRPRRRPLA